MSSPEKQEYQYLRNEWPNRRKLFPLSSKKFVKIQNSAGKLNDSMIPEEAVADLLISSHDNCCYERMGDFRFVPLFVLFASTSLFNPIQGGREFDPKVSRGINSCICRTSGIHVHLNP